MHPAPTSELANHVTLTVCIPCAVYDHFAEIWGHEGGVAERAAALMAEAAAFGSPGDLYEDLEATSQELAALRAQLAAVALLLTEGRPAGAR